MKTSICLLSKIAVCKKAGAFVRLFAVAAFLCVATSGSDARAARPFVVGGRVISIDRPFRPGLAPQYEGNIVARVTPPKSTEIIRNVSPPRIVPHYLPNEGDYEPRRYPGVTVVAVPPRPGYVPDPMTGVDLSPRPTGLPPTIPGPRQATPMGLLPGADPYRPSPFDPDVLRRQGLKRF